VNTTLREGDAVIPLENTFGRSPKAYERINTATSNRNPENNFDPLVTE